MITQVPNSSHMRHAVSLRRLMMFVLVSLLTTHAYAEPSKSKSEVLQKSGEAKVGAPLPFFSGWDLTQPSRPMNNRMILRSKKEKYVVSLCASWCEPCMEGLERLSKARKQFDKAGVELVLYIVRDERSRGLALRERFKFSWATIMIDEYGENAKRLAPGEREGLKLPRTFVIDGRGIVQKIIGREGDDYIRLLLNK